jgi:hypothetical protein
MVQLMAHDILDVLSYAQYLVGHRILLLIAERTATVFAPQTPNCHSTLFVTSFSYFKVASCVELSTVAR